MNSSQSLVCVGKGKYITIPTWNQGKQTTFSSCHKNAECASHINSKFPSHKRSFLTEKPDILRNKTSQGKRLQSLRTSWLQLVFSFASAKFIARGGASHTTLRITSSGWKSYDSARRTISYHLVRLVRDESQMVWKFFDRWYRFVLSRCISPRTAP